MKQFHCISELIQYIKENHDSPTHFNYRYNEKWHSITTHEFFEEVRHMALGLKAMGVEHGDKIVIFSDSSPWWLITDFAILLLGAISVPIFAKISAENFSFEVEQTQPKWIFVAGDEPWVILKEHPDLIEKGIALEPHEGDKALLSFESVIQKGKELDKQDPSAFDAIEKHAQPDDIATIIYTSGSTGVPKGAVLTQRAVIGVAHADVFELRAGLDRYLNILPLAHIFARNVIYNLLAWGPDIYFVDDVKNIGAIFREIKPTVAIVVPRLMEKVYSKILSKVQESSPVRRFIGMMAIYVAQQEDNFFKRLLVPIFERLVYRKLREGLGGEVRGLLSGGAPLTTQLSQFFNTIWVPLFSGWGITEGGCTISNDVHGNKYGTIGTSIGIADIMISGKEELLVKGHTVMNEYYQDPEKTKKVIDEDGWLHTGDKATVDDEGFYTIIGRFKELYKTSTGEYIAPVPIEQEMTRSPIIDMAMVVAEHRKYATCLFFPDFDVLENIKKKKKKQELTVEEFLNSNYIKRKMKELIENVNKDLNKWEQIRDYRFIPKTPTIEEGELTPTMKMKRDVIVNKYCHIIDSMYSEENK